MIPRGMSEAQKAKILKKSAEKKAKAKKKKAKAKKQAQVAVEVVRVF